MKKQSLQRIVAVSLAANLLLLAALFSKEVQCIATFDLTVTVNGETLSIGDQIVDKSCFGQWIEIEISYSKALELAELAQTSSDPTLRYQFGGWALVSHLPPGPPVGHPFIQFPKNW